MKKYPGMKICAKCQRVLPVKDFYRKRNQWCKECHVTHRIGENRGSNKTIVLGIVIVVVVIAFLVRLFS